MTTINKAIDVFANDMKLVMLANKKIGKSGWNSIALNEALKRIHEELGELVDAALFISMNWNNAQGWHDLQKEVVDVANFCMMIHHLADYNTERIKGILK